MEREGGRGRTRNDEEIGLEGGRKRRERVGWGEKG